MYKPMTTQSYLSGLAIKGLLEAFKPISYAIMISMLDIDSAQAESMSKGIDKVVLLAPQKLASKHKLKPEANAARWNCIVAPSHHPSILIASPNGLCV